MQLPKWLQSSADEEKLALTVKGVLVGVTPLIILLSGVRGWHLTQTDLDVAINAVVNLLSVLGMFVASIITLVGAGRKIFYAIKNNSNIPPPTPPTPVI